jgi:DNA-directed RNA polymerase sigma subunit (sigma70/sigma32)
MAGAHEFLVLHGSQASGRRLLARLSFREREIVKLLYGIGHKHKYTLVGAARVCNITRERVRAVRDKALTRLGEMIAGQVE